ncbi:Kazal-type serine protease inhibitor [Crocinitomicaceae bacterium]|nr:Kazal-type serine protease inhibitor [Crocinitomicaceae bacterium]MDB4606819.1 Kazal-type serine protease inhibitor [Crocinitomicaceae bacterium]
MKSIFYLTFSALLLTIVISCLKQENCRSVENIAQETCIDSSLIDPSVACTEQYDPVCGCNGVTYSNACHADRNGITSYEQGPCCTN